MLGPVHLHLSTGRGGKYEKAMNNSKLFQKEKADACAPALFVCLSAFQPQPGQNGAHHRAAAVDAGNLQVAGGAVFGPAQLIKVVKLFAGVGVHQGAVGIGGGGGGH